MRILKIIAVILLLVFPASVQAESRVDIESRLREALRANVQELSKLQSELESIRQQKATLEEKLHLLEEQVKVYQEQASKKPAVRTQIKKLNEQIQKNAELETSLGVCKKKLDEVQAERQMQQDKKEQIEQLLASQTARLEVAQEKNNKMYIVAQEIIDWISREGVCSALVAFEPILGLSRVEMESFVQDYADKLLDNKLTSANVE